MKTTIFILSFLLLQSCLKPEEVENKFEVVKSMGDTLAKQYSDITQITIEDMQKLGKESFVLVDVRSAPEVGISYIPDSITQKYFEENLSKYKTKKVIAYSTIGTRSSKYVRMIKDKKLDALNMKEGILGWAHRKLPLLDGGKETLRVHVYTDAWNFAPEGYEGVYK